MVSRGGIWRIVYLAMILHRDYEISESFHNMRNRSALLVFKVSHFERQPYEILVDNTDWRFRTVAIHYQITIPYKIFHLCQGRHGHSSRFILHNFN
ncbi:hypothetical protein PM082_001160 [Marasmius tenuissimus]|nr:hypothetical protein PM082_001160 [Marasmius tenuissimus]